MQRAGRQIVRVLPTFRLTVFPKSVHAAPDESPPSAFEGDEVAEDFAQRDGFNSPAGIRLRGAVEGMNTVREQGRVFVIRSPDGKHVGRPVAARRADQLQALFGRSGAKVFHL